MKLGRLGRSNELAIYSQVSKIIQQVRVFVKLTKIEAKDVQSKMVEWIAVR